MSSAINVAFVGCGGMAAHYLAVYRDVAWVHVAACIDVDREAAERAGQTLNATLTTTDFDAALAPEIDAVVINTPNSLHRAQAVAAIAAGKHVLLQKPVAATLSDAEAIARAAQESSRTVGLYMSYFDQPLLHDLREMAGQMRFGSIVQCYARLMHRGGMMWSREAVAGRPTWRGSIAQTGGGCFIQLAVHYVHIFEWLTGAHVVKATGLVRKLHCPGLEGEDLASAILELDSGAMATIDTAWCADGEELAVFGTEGRAQYRANRQLDVSSSAGPFNGRVVKYTGGLKDAFGGPIGAEQTMEVVPPAFGDITNPFNQHRLFLEAARDGRPAPVSIDSGVRDMRVVAAVYESARTSRTVEVR